MRVTAPHLPGLPELDIDTGRGKLSAAIDLRATDDREWLRTLVREAHVFVQGYRPGGLAAKGFSPEALAEMRPGIVAVTLSAYGHEGPWANRRGFDSLVQNASGINVAEAEAAGRPRAKGTARAGPRSRHRLPDGLRRHDGPAAQGARRAAPGTCACRSRRPAIG